MLFGLPETTNVSETASQDKERDSQSRQRNLYHDNWRWSARYAEKGWGVVSRLDQWPVASGRLSGHWVGCQGRNVCGAVYGCLLLVSTPTHCRE